MCSLGTTQSLCREFSGLNAEEALKLWGLFHVFYTIGLKKPRGRNVRQTTVADFFVYLMKARLCKFKKVKRNLCFI